MQPIDGKKIAQRIRDQIKAEITEKQITPGLAVLMVGEDEASKIYVNLKEKAASEAGIHFEKYHYGQDVGEEEIVTKIQELNARLDINGIIVQLPLPENFNTEKIIQCIDPEKDVDGFHPQNLEKFLSGQAPALSPLIRGIEKILISIDFNFTDKSVYLLVKEGVFAETLKKFFTDKGVSVLMGHAEDKIYIQKADLILTALGQARFLSGENIKNGAVVIDVGINKNEEGKTVGDFNPESTADKEGFYTPVPGGTGPLTVAMLLQNVLDFYKKQNNI